MSTELPPPSKRQKREQLERTQTQQDASAILPVEGSFKARFIDGEGNQLANVVEVPLANATEKDISLLRKAQKYIACRGLP
jgi:ribosome assembly protein 4